MRPQISDKQMDDAIAERRERRHRIMKRDVLKEFGEVPLILILFALSVATGAFSSLWLSHQFDIAISTGRQLPPFLFMGKTFIVGLFTSMVTLGSFLLYLLAALLYGRAVQAEKEDEKKGHARTRRF